jgi:septum formation protein
MLILASSSPRRQELLRAARILFKTYPADVPEVQRPGEAPRDFAERLACEKARAVFAAVSPPAGTFVLGADTIVVVGGEVLGKPVDEAEAARMLRRLSGRQHEVTTGVCLVGRGQETGHRERGTGKGDGGTGNRRQEGTFEDVRSATTQVFFSELSDEEIEEYIATGEPMDKAGAYAIQGAASRWIPRIEGCYFNVVGLPVPLVWRMLREVTNSESNE